jgi:hypothetical protein
MNKKSKDEYFVLFQGAKISKREANRIGVGLIFGFVIVIAPSKARRILQGESPCREGISNDFL